MTTYKYQVEITNKVASGLPKNISDLKDAQKSAADTFEKVHHFLSTEFFTNMKKSLIDQFDIDEIELKIDLDTDTIISMLDEIRSALVVNMGINEKNIADVSDAFNRFLEQEEGENNTFVQNVIAELYKEYQDEFNSNLIKQKNELVNEVMKVIPNITDELSSGNFFEQDLETDEFSFTNRINEADILQRTDIHKAISQMRLQEMSELIEDLFPRDFDPFAEREDKTEAIRNKMDQLRNASEELEDYLKEVEDEDKGHYIKVKEKIGRLTETKENLASEIEMAIKSMSEQIGDVFKENLSSFDMIKEGSELQKYLMTSFEESMKDAVQAIMEHAQDTGTYTLYRPQTIFRREMRKRSTQSNMDLTDVESSLDYRELTAKIETDIIRQLANFYQDFAPKVQEDEELELTSVSVGNAFAKFLEGTRFEGISVQLGEILAKSLSQQWQSLETEFEKVMEVKGMEDIYPMIKFQRNMRANLFEMLKNKENSGLLDMLNSDMDDLFDEDEVVEGTGVSTDTLEGFFTVQTGMMESLLEMSENTQTKMLSAIRESVDTLSAKMDATERNIIGALETEEQRNIREVNEMTQIPTDPSHMRGV